MTLKQYWLVYNLGVVQKFMQVNHYSLLTYKLSTEVSNSLLKLVEKLLDNLLSAKHTTLKPF